MSTKREGEALREELREAGSFEPAAILAELEEKAGGGGIEPLPPSLPIDRIKTMPELFQCRAVSEGHVGDLSRAVAAGSVLPALLVVQVGEMAVLIDGHHRLEALRAAGSAGPVSVEFFKGTLRAAVLAACAANSKTKLPMSHGERADTAWRFVLMGVFSKARIAEASGVASRTVANMRSVKLKLGSQAFEVVSWQRAIMLANNCNPADMTDDEREDWLETMAQRHADTMAKTFASQLTSNPEVAGRALAIHFGRRLPAVVAELSGWLPEGGEEDY